MDSKPATEQIVSWMREHLDQEISMEEMAEKAGVTPFHFLRTFRRWTGVTPALFLSALRLEEAKRLLLTTDRSVTDICFDVGYNSLGTFTTRFTQLAPIIAGAADVVARAIVYAVLHATSAGTMRSYGDQLPSALR